MLAIDVLPPVPVSDDAAAPAPRPRLVVGHAPDVHAGPGQVRIKVLAAGVNRADVLQAAGSYPPPAGASTVLGLEVSGVIDEVGPGVSAFSTGEPVMALLDGGGYAEFAIADARCVLPIPAGVDPVIAAGLPEALATANSNLHRAGIKAGDWVLIHGGSGGVGSHAIQIAAALGAKVLATAGTAERVAKLLDLGATAVADYHDFDAEEALGNWVMAQTDGHGADIVLDVLGGARLDANIRTLAEGGRVVVIGSQAGNRATINTTRLMRRRASIIGTTLRSRSGEEKAAIIADVARDVLPLLQDGRLRPVVGATYPIAEAAQAHADITSSKVFGKALLIL